MRYLSIIKTPIGPRYVWAQPVSNGLYLVKELDWEHVGVRAPGEDGLTLLLEVNHG